MHNVFKAVPIADDVYWVGAIDWAVRDFHGYLTRHGTTYNAFLVLADKVTLIDTVKEPFVDEMFARIGSVIDPLAIDYIVSNHAEPDHAGAMVETVRRIDPQTVFASKRGVEALHQHYGDELAIQPVGDGESISLGNMSLQCIETRMCHWPESMICWLAERGVLFSQDIFGLHHAASPRFDDEVGLDLLDREAGSYFANILMPLTVFVTRALDRLAELDLPIKVLAPDHGPVRRTHIGRVIEQYRRWVRQPRTNKAVVLYATMWGSTDLMARALAEGLAAGGADVRMMPANGIHRSDAATELLDAGALLVAAPTLNNGIFPSLLDTLGYIRGLKPKGLVGAAVGSFGWSGEAALELTRMLEEMKIELVGQPIRVRYAPDAAALKQCHDLGLAVAGRMKERHGAD